MIIYHLILSLIIVHSFIIYDQAGRQAVHTIVDILNKNYPSIEIDIAYPYRHKDWNDYLVYGIKHKENDIIVF